MTNDGSRTWGYDGRMSRALFDARARDTSDRVNTQDRAAQQFLNRKHDYLNRPDTTRLAADPYAPRYQCRNGHPLLSPTSWCYRCNETGAGL